MAVLQFTLSEDGVSVLRDALTCLSKFSDEVSLEAKRDRVRVERRSRFVSSRLVFIRHHHLSLTETPSSLDSWF